MLSFVRQAVKDFKRTGSVWPSSPQLGKAMTRSLRRNGQAGAAARNGAGSKATAARRVLEVGPGTGPFTKMVLEELMPGDEFDIVEINDTFCQQLEERLLAPYRKKRKKATVRLHCAPIEDAPIVGPYDFIVCGLPFNNFPPKVVRSIFRRLMSLLKPGGELAYFEYAGVRIMKAPLVGAKGRKNLKEIGRVGKALRRRHAGKRELVLGNIPPAMTVRLTRGVKAN
jgi:phosphatidylethanolamine/phosphatidyl-N-methylethanolamine N-methyltransferase